MKNNLLLLFEELYFREKMSAVSFYIPHVFPNISKERIAYSFQSNDLGQVGSVDFVAKRDKNGKSYHSAFVHFTTWGTSDCATRFLERVNDPAKEARLVYEDPWFWIVLPYQSKEEVPAEKRTFSGSVVARPPVGHHTALVDVSYARQLEAEIARLRETCLALTQENDALRRAGTSTTTTGVDIML